MFLFTTNMVDDEIIVSFFVPIKDNNNRASD